MDRGAVAFAKNEDLAPCPFCGGRPHVIETEWAWGPFDLRHVKIRCIDCGAVFTYDWRPSPYKYMPHAIEWWNTRATSLPPPEYIHGYHVDYLTLVADFLKEKGTTALELEEICDKLQNIESLAERKFAADMIEHLQKYLAGERRIVTKTEQEENND